MKAPLGVAILGATGSIGRQTLDVIRSFPDRFRVVGLSAYSHAEQMVRLAQSVHPAVVVMGQPQAADQVRQSLADPSVQVQCGEEALAVLASHAQVDMVVSAIVGRAGLGATFAAVQAGKQVALANKESLVMAGEIIMAEAKRKGASLLPVDSEHAAIHQLLLGRSVDQVRRIILTASGGPFWGRSRQQLEQVTVSEALAHPRWEMGAKISVDSATMVNKGFEVIEARWLFDVAPEKIEVVVHPQSVVHGMIELLDGSVLAQMGMPDMRGPIAHALGFPHQLDLPGTLAGWQGLNLPQIGMLTFCPCLSRELPAVEICRQALQMGGGAPAALSVADELVVQAFLDGAISFSRIMGVLEQVLLRIRPRPVSNIKDVLAAGAEGAELARELLRG